MSAARTIRPRELGVGDVAAAHGIHRNVARNWMKEWEREHGASVVYRRAGRFYTTDVAMARMHLVPQSTEVMKATSEHRAKIADLERQLTAVSQELIDFRRTALAWYKRTERLESVVLRKGAPVEG